jgi:hypothetical protein
MTIILVLTRPHPTRPDHDYLYIQSQEMGFQRNDAQRALDLAGGSLSGAMQLLTT